MSRETPSQPNRLACSGTFEEVRHVKSRSVIQIVIEVPIEQADAALSTLGGVPKPGRPVWVAMAVMGETQPAPPQMQAKDEPEDLRRGSATRQSAILCNYANFQMYLIENYAGLLGRELGDDVSLADIVEILRLATEVSSRKEYDESQEARARWLDLRADFEAWAKTQANISSEAREGHSTAGAALLNLPAGV
jgi:hypothetical protein